MPAIPPAWGGLAALPERHLGHRLVVEVAEVVRHAGKWPPQYAFIHNDL
ncbi:hypothetical protein [Salinispora arenicola]|nr:hypothetical protein [Salinispora arenicola]